MKRSLLIFFSFIFGLSSIVVYAQRQTPDDSRFQNGKELMDIGKYGLAMQSFKPLTSNYDGNKYQKISSFYYAVCAFRNGDEYLSRDMFLQLLINFPQWQKSEEVKLWLANIYFKESNFSRALQLTSEIQHKNIKSEVEGLKYKYLAQLNFTQLDSLLKTNPGDRTVAKCIADKIVDMPIVAQDRDYLENIVSVYDLDKARYRVEESLKSEKKDIYHIAVLLPFMIDDLKQNSKNISNEFVIQLYQGIMLGANNLKNRGIDVRLHLYDTKKDSTVTANILMQDEMRHMDLMVGPLYPGPVKVASDFAFINKINMINPLSSNSEVIRNNPYAFLFMPTSESVGVQMADYISHITNNKNAFIFMGTSARDSILAYTYKNEIENRGFKVCYMEKIANDQAKRILDILTNTISIEFDASEFDSVLVEDKTVGNLRITEKDYLVIQPDSIGHVFVASDNTPLVANTITGLETRGDTVMLVGSARWLDKRVVSLEGLKRLNCKLSAPTFVDKSKPAYSTLYDLCKETFYTYPTRNFFVGYETMMAMGKLLHKYGTLFQFDPGINDTISGEIFQGTLFGAHNSNQIVPIVEFQDSELTVTQK